MKRVSGLKGHHSYFELTFDLLPLFSSDELGNFHRIPYERVPTNVMHSTFDGRFKLNDINDEAEFVVNWLDFAGIKREGRGLAGPLIAHILL